MLLTPLCVNGTFFKKLNKEKLKIHNSIPYDLVYCGNARTDEEVGL